MPYGYCFPIFEESRDKMNEVKEAVIDRLGKSYNCLYIPDRGLIVTGMVEQEDDLIRTTARCLRDYGVQYGKLIRESFGINP